MSINTRKRARKGDNDEPADLDWLDTLLPKDDGSPDPEVSKTSWGPVPKMNSYVHTDANMVTITVGLPGLKPGDVSITLLHDTLMISGEHANVQPLAKGMYTCREIPKGKFSRVVKVPLGMRPEDFKAHLENGLLTMTFPRDLPKQEPHRIPIE